MPAMTTRLHLVRHGQTDWNRELRYQGQLDTTTLNQTGLAQALGIAQTLQGETFTALYTSPLQRAQQTAHILSAALHTPLHIDPRLTEVNHGAWQGRCVAEIQQDLPQEGDPRLLDPLNGRAPGGESLVEVYQRMAAAADDYAANHPGQAVLIVSHGVSIATLICKASSIPLNQVYSLIPDNSDIISLTWPNDKPLQLNGDNPPLKASPWGGGRQ